MPLDSRPTTAARPIRPRAAGRGPRPHRLLAAALIAPLLAAAPLAARACGYHVGEAARLSVAHPSSLPVAIAIGAAVGAGLLAPVADGAGPLALVRATGTMRTFAGALDAPGAGLPPIAVVLVEAHLWGRIDPAAGAPTLAAHVAGPAGGDLVVVTGEPALRALIDGRFAWDDALARGLVVLDGPPDARERLSRLLSRRFV